MYPLHGTCELPIQDEHITMNTQRLILSNINTVCSHPQYYSILTPVLYRTWSKTTYSSQAWTSLLTDMSPHYLILLLPLNEWWRCTLIVVYDYNLTGHHICLELGAHTVRTTLNKFWTNRQRCENAGRCLQRRRFWSIHPRCENAASSLQSWHPLALFYQHQH